MAEEGWEVRDELPEHEGDHRAFYCVQRGVGLETETAASRIQDYGLACVIEATCNLRDGTVE